MFGCWRTPIALLRLFGPDVATRWSSERFNHGRVMAFAVVHHPLARLGAVVRQVAGVEKVTQVLRLPESVPLETVQAQVDWRLPRGMVSFATSESTPGG